MYKRQALNKPAYKSSVYNDSYGTFPAHYANDGSRNTDYTTAPYCAVTNKDANPWWAVDLEQPTDIYRVDLTTSVLTSRETNISSLELL